jgi:uncharacterized membrane protein
MSRLKSLTNFEASVAYFLAHLRRYFLTGLLVITPIWGTYLILKTLLVTLDNILGDILRRHLDFYVPGLGIVVLVAIILSLGVVATNFLGRELVRVWEALLQRVPVVRSVYTMVKSIVDAISLQQKDQFNRVVLVQFPRLGHYSIAFVTGVVDEVQRATAEAVVGVYVPTTPNPTSGYLIYVPEKEIVPLQMSVEDGMKLVISGGFYSPDAAKKRAPVAAGRG